MYYIFWFLTLAVVAAIANNVITFLKWRRLHWLHSTRLHPKHRVKRTNKKKKQDKPQEVSYVFMTFDGGPIDGETMELNSESIPYEWSETSEANKKQRAVYRLRYKLERYES